MTKEIGLTKGKVALVEDADFEWINGWKWHFAKGYAVRNERRQHIFMHNLIMGTPKDMITDHIDFDTLNNQRRNLRICTLSDNQHNRKKQANNTSGFKGVNWHNKTNKWIAKIGVMGKRIHLGLFTNVQDAAKAYDVAALKYHGQFAYTNFPQDIK